MANLTLSIDAELLKKARKLAIDRDTTANALVRDHLERLVIRNDKITSDFIRELKEYYAKTKVSFGGITWTREELHER